MKPQEITRVESWLRAAFGNQKIKVTASKASATPELWVAGEFLGTIHRDEEEGEVSYNVNIVELEEDLL